MVTTVWLKRPIPETSAKQLSELMRGKQYLTIINGTRKLEVTRDKDNPNWVWVLDCPFPRPRGTGSVSGAELVELGKKVSLGSKITSRT